MGLLDSLKGIRKALTLDSNPFGGFSHSIEPLPGKLPVFPEWFFTARIGQPRNINIQEVRTFAKSPWTQMVLGTIKREVSTIPWDIVPIDANDGVDYKEKIKTAKNWYQNVNGESETINDLHSMLITDLGEIDAGTMVKVYSVDSYEDVEQPLYDTNGKQTGSQMVNKLKPFGQRELKELVVADGSTFLKQIDIYKRLIAYYQYSYKNPRTNPQRFDADEVVYYCMNKKSYALYGYSPVQSIQQVLETLLNATRWNKDFFKNNAIPDGMISLPGASPEQMAQFKRQVLKSVKGKAHQLLFQNTDAKWEKFSQSAKDMEWLEGQKWYSQLTFAVFGISPVEAGFHENVSQGNQAGQERITVKNGVKPYLELLARKQTKEVLPELFQEENPGIKFVYKPKEHVEEQIEFEQNTKLMEIGAMTINEFRKERGDDPVEWGDEPISSLNTSQETSEVQSPQQDPQQQNLDSEKKSFMKRFGGFLNRGD